MGLKAKGKKAATTAVSVSLATSGLSSCNDNGAVDPPPPPLQCNNVDMGQTLQATGQLVDGVIEASIRHMAFDAAVQWQDIQIDEVQGGTLGTVDLPSSAFEPIVVRITPDEGITSGSFRLRGTLVGARDEQCAVTRTFTFEVNQGVVTVALHLRDRLPLLARQYAELSVERRERDLVEVRARTAYPGRYRVAWSVSGGELLRVEGDVASWRLPAEAGYYQIEAALDFGDDGMAFDTMMFEVA